MTEEYEEYKDAVEEDDDISEPHIADEEPGLFPYIDQVMVNHISYSGVLVVAYVACVCMIVPAHLIWTFMWAVFTVFMAQYIVNAT